MVGFAEYTNTYETRLGRVPFYRKGARGPDQLSTFASKKNAEYWANAGRIRDMRFAQANEYNIDRAIRSQRERYISNAMDTVADTRELEGLRGRTSMKLSRTGGALSRYGTPSVVKGETPMSLTVAGLANGDGVRAVQRASAPPMSSGGDPRFASSRSSARSGTYAYGGGARRPPPMSKGRPPSDTDSDTDSDSYRSIPSHELKSAIQNHKKDLMDRWDSHWRALREQDINRNNIPQSPQNPTPTKQYETPRGPSVSMADLVHHSPEPTMMDKKFAPADSYDKKSTYKHTHSPEMFAESAAKLQKTITNFDDIVMRPPQPFPNGTLRERSRARWNNEVSDADMKSYGTPADALSIQEKMNAERRQSKKNNKAGKRRLFTK